MRLERGCRQPRRPIALRSLAPRCALCMPRSAALRCKCCLHTHTHTSPLSHQLHCMHLCSSSAAAAPGSSSSGGSSSSSSSGSAAPARSAARRSTIRSSSTSSTSCAPRCAVCACVRACFVLDGGRKRPWWEGDTEVKSAIHCQAPRRTQRTTTRTHTHTRTHARADAAAARAAADARRGHRRHRRDQRQRPKVDPRRQRPPGALPPPVLKMADGVGAAPRPQRDGRAAHPGARQEVRRRCCAFVAVAGAGAPGAGRARVCANNICLPQSKPSHRRRRPSINLQPANQHHQTEHPTP